MSKDVTMKDIAEAMGISIVSVSKAMAGKKGVSEDMREKILEKADQLGYQHAKRKKHPQTHQGNIGILVADHFFTESAFYANMYSNLLKKAAEYAYVGILEMISEREAAVLTTPRFMHGNNVSGIIVMGELPPKYVEMISGLGLPYILLDFYMDDGHGSDSVVSDGVFGTYQLTRHLIKLGHKRIGFVGSRLATSSIMDRYLGYHKALLQAGLAMRNEWVIEDRRANGRFLEALDLPADLPTAFVCNCDEIAHQFMEQLKQAGYRIPQDISVVGFDDFRFATMCVPPLTTFRVNMEEMSEATIGRLIRKMLKKRYTDGRMVINGQVVYRASTAAPREG